jgi:CheY-like chemotaxis protein
MSLLSSGSENIVVRVKDAGAGFDEATLPRLLEPFTKDDWHTPGAGLGLHITQNLVHSLGGKLRLTSQIGIGTLFEVTVPCRLNHQRRSESIIHEVIRPSTPTPARPAPVSTIPNPGQAESNGLTSTSSIRILVVDDNALCRRILVKGLKKGKTPIETCEAADGQAALDYFPTFNPDLVLTDVSMPIMDGITSAELMRTVSAERKMKECKIYAITGLGSTDPRLKTVALNGTAALDGWLVKGKDDLKVISRIVEDVYEEKIRA